MPPEVILRPEAERDIEESASWYEFQQPGLGLEFLNEIQSVFNRVKQNPAMYKIMHKSVRRALIHKFPFGMYYCATEKDVVIIAVMHVSRNPRYWLERTS